MRPSRTITLFAPPPPSTRSGSAAFVVSVLVHVAAYGWLMFGLRNAPRLATRTSHEHLTVRILNMPSPEPQARQSAANQVAYSAPVPASVPHAPGVPKAAAPAAAAPAPAVAKVAAAAAPAPAAPRLAAVQPAPGPPPGGSPAAMPSVADQLAKLKPKTQILIQPEAPPDVVIQHPVLVPNILRWTAPAIPTKTILPSPPQKPILTKVRPSIEPPNHEVMPANVKMASSQFPTNMPTLPASTTMPVVVRGPDPAKRVPETTSAKQTQPATPAQILSLSNLQTHEGPAAIPLANSPAAPAIRESTGTGSSVNSAGTGQGNPVSKQSGNGPGHGAGSPASTATSGNGAGTQVAKAAGPAGTGQGGQGTAQGTAQGPPGPASGGQGGGTPGPASGAKGGGTPGPAGDANAGGDVGPVLGGPVTRIHLAKDGQFGFVVVGSAIAEQYPETVGLWGGRLVYTVYVHMSSGKPWILQYALPASEQAAGKPDAPWPFDIVQPHLDSADYTADALMVHGFVNVAGRFDRLAVVFPSDFAKAKFLLSALQQWQFRPGRQNGQLSTVEVLLIIPDENE